MFSTFMFIIMWSSFKTFQDETGNDFVLITLPKDPCQSCTETSHGSSVSGSDSEATVLYDWKDTAPAEDLQVKPFYESINGGSYNKM